ncbi:NUDIX domain-containing protein [Helicobacter sp. 16-1353]|uniref:NUDIX domain-containing protein n=1 Tax=Helicobacter sp. 16-1353 TaxID=2004996 RepID=UPI0011BD4CA9|nr:NUDIX domain-containing protein [Helicobacter sp. 16-1353]
MSIDTKSIRIYDCKDSKYIKIKQMSYIEDGIQKTWDIVSSHDSVSILLYNKDNRSIIIVKQFRPAVFLRNNNGYMYELCSGLVDKANKTIEEIAIEEVYEECGYKVDSVTKIAEFYSSVGTSASRQSIFYAEITNNDKVACGGGVDNECIEIIEIPLNQIKDILNKPNITPSIGFAFMWFIFNKNIKE